MEDKIFVISLEDDFEIRDNILNKNLNLRYCEFSSISYNNDKEFLKSTSRGICDSDIILFVWNQMTNNSEYVVRAINMAARTQKPIFVLREDGLIQNEKILSYLKLSENVFMLSDISEFIKKLQQWQLEKNLSCTVPCNKVLKIYTNMDCNVYIDKIRLLGTATVEEPLTVELLMGKYNLTFESTKNHYLVVKESNFILTSNLEYRVDLQSLQTKYLYYVPDIYFIKYIKENKIGYKLENEDINITSAKFDEAYDFCNGFARVKIGRKYGVIDKKGNYILPVNFDAIDDFIDGFARVKIGRKYGVIDKKGNYILPVNFDAIDDFIDGLAKVKIGRKYGAINIQREFVIPCIYDDLYIDLNGFSIVGKRKIFPFYKIKYAYLSENSHVITPFKYDLAFHFENGLAKVRVGNNFGVIDTNGKEIIPLQYDYISIFDYGVLKVKKNGYYGLINKMGKIIAPIKYSYISDFENGFAKVFKSGKYGLIDKVGNVCIPVEYDDINFLISKIAVREGHYWGLMDYNGIKLTDFKYEFISKFSFGFAKVGKGGKWGFIDVNGKELTPIIYDTVYSFFSPDCAKVERDGKCFYLYSNGKEELIQHDYESSTSCSRSQKEWHYPLEPLNIDVKGEISELRETDESNI